MNSSRFWAGFALCLPALGCQLTISHRRSCPPVSCVAHSVDTDCSGLASVHSNSAADSTATRLPYGYRWTEYQGADIEHDIYGDRQLRYRPGCRTCFPARPAGCTTLQKSIPAPDCGCAQDAAPPLPPPPVPAPLQPVPPMPADVEPEPMEPALVEPTPAAPPAVEPAPIEAANPAEPPAESTTEPSPQEPTPEHPAPLEPNIVPPRNEIPSQTVPRVKSKESGRLIPTQILPAVPPSGVPAPRSDLRQNAIPTLPAKTPSNETKGNSGGFLYDLLLGPKR
jgi:hypothetical protein